VEALENDNLFVSVVSIGEIAKGIALLKESKNKRELQAWLQALERYYADRVLPVDLETSHTWGELTRPRRERVRSFPQATVLLLLRRDATACTS